MKKILFIFFILFIITGCNSKLEDFSQNKVNLNDNVINDQIIGNLNTKNTSVIYEKGITTFKTTITNTGENINNITFKVVFKNKNESIITTLIGNIDEIKTNQEKNVLISSDMDLTNAYKIEYIIG